jgi:hypothetical protein
MIKKPSKQRRYGPLQLRLVLKQYIKHGENSDRHTTTTETNIRFDDTAENGGFIDEV